jgi:hypothetical protein
VRSTTGADLEDAAIDAAMEEQRRAPASANMVFVRQADIGRPDALLSALRSAGLSPEGAVMLVGNGFHEVRGQTDESMVEVFRGYHSAGFVLLFTEESALSIDDLRATAWNTYHAGFKYVRKVARPARTAAAPRTPRPADARTLERMRPARRLRARGRVLHAHPDRLSLPAQGRIQPFDQREPLLRAGGHREDASFEGLGSAVSFRRGRGVSAPRTS